MTSLGEIKLRRAEGQNPYYSNPQLGNHYREDVNFLLDRLAVYERRVEGLRQALTTIRVMPGFGHAGIALAADDQLAGGK